jgi:hypothetical protein
MIILADVGVPMIVIQWPLMLFALVPVILVEVFTIRRWLPLSTREAFKGITLGNLLSTLVGIPLAWLLMFGLALGADVAQSHWKFELNGPVWAVLGFLLNAAWLAPYES